MDTVLELLMLVGGAESQRAASITRFKYLARLLVRACSSSRSVSGGSDFLDMGPTYTQPSVHRK